MPPNSFVIFLYYSPNQTARAVVCFGCHLRNGSTTCTARLGYATPARYICCRYAPPELRPRRHVSCPTDVSDSGEATTKKGNLHADHVSVEKISSSCTLAVRDGGRAGKVGKATRRQRLRFRRSGSNFFATYSQPGVEITNERTKIIRLA